MKRIVSILIATLFLVTNAFAYTTTVRARGMGILVTTGVGNTIKITPKTEVIKGWEVEQGNIEIVDNKFIMPEEDVKIKGIVETGEEKYLLAIESPYFIDKEYRQAGEIITLQAITEAEGYLFSSWTATGLTLTEVQRTNPTITFTMPANEVTLVVNYTEAPQEYIVTFDANGGTGSMEPQTFTVGTPQNLTLNRFTNTGKTFAGWSRNQNATTNELTDGQSYNGTGNITLYAIWTTDAYTISYDLDGGNVTGNPGTYSVDTDAITLINPTKDGYTFLGWTGSNGSTPNTTVTIPTGSTGNKTYTANWELNTYTVTFNKNDGSGTTTTTTQTFTHGVAQKLTTNTFTREGYNFLGWSADSGATTATYTDGQSYTTTSDATLYAVWEEFKWNAPVIATGLTPVNWNGSAWVTTTEANWEYNYDVATAGHNTVAGDGTGKWANAQTSDGSLYVWIPRYTYKITSGYHSSGNSWSSVGSAGSNKIEVKFSNGTTDDTSSSYLKHPAFTFGTDELKGIWVAKYEASRNDATSSSAGSGTTVTFKPGVQSWRSLSVSKMYDYAYNLNRTLDSHLMKNSEWGAVAYLTNAIGKIPYINNSNSFITGNAGGSQDASSASGVTNAWNAAKGVKASTTHNVYGIYDLSGGAFEYVSAYYTDGVSTSLSGDKSSKSYAGSLYTNRNTKYVEKYSTAYDSTKTGDAVYETSSRNTFSSSWDGDYSYTPNSNYPVFLRGGGYYNASNAGVFGYFDSGDGSASPNHGFRAVLAIP